MILSLLILLLHLSVVRCDLLIVVSSGELPSFRPEHWFEPIANHGFPN
jgi:hypothetical protein